VKRLLQPRANTTSGQFVFGNEQDGPDTNTPFDPTQALSGTYFEARVFNDVRTADEILQNYQHKLDLTPSEAADIGLLANYQFDGLVNNQVVDTVSGNNLSIGHANISGFVASTVVGDLHVAENAESGTSVGFVVPHESPDSFEESFTFSLTDDANGRFTIDSETGRISVLDGAQLDHETDTTHNVTVEVTDGENNVVSEEFTITVDDVDDSPVNASPIDLSTGIEL